MVSKRGTALPTSSPVEGSMNSTMVPRLDLERVFLEDQQKGVDMLARGKGERGHLQGKVMDVRQPGCAVRPVGSIVHYRLGQLHLPLPEGLAYRSRSAAAVPCVAGGVSHAKLGHEPGEGLGGGVLAETCRLAEEMLSSSSRCR